MKALAIILFFGIVYFFVWALCRAAKGGLPDIEDVVESGEYHMEYIDADTVRLTKIEDVEP